MTNATSQASMRANEENHTQTNEALSKAHNKSIKKHTAQTFTKLPEVKPETPLLNLVNAPKDLKQFSIEQLNQLADELRHYLLYCTGQSGGHFGANLGVVELTIALHYVLNTPDDRLVWDVGHQAYAHKVLTGRRDQLSTIRSKGGLTAFPERQESPYDTFGVGHSSTSISAGLGMAMAIKHQQQDKAVVCVIGDGAMTAGMAFEAMNDAVQHDADMLVILNDNDMSISCSIGGFSKHLASLWHSGYQVDVSLDGKPEIKARPNMAFADRETIENKPEIPTNLFDAIGFQYFGPFDGHDVAELVSVMTRLKQVKGPKLLHVYTTKGKGFIPAEADPIAYHAIGKIKQDKKVLSKLPKPTLDKKITEINPQAKKYSAVFGEFICDTAKADNKLMAITPAMCEGSGMVQYAKEHGKRFFDVAIAEQHAVTLAAGMACEGLKPIVAIYSTFLQRGFDQLVHDVALQNLDVTFAIDRAGLVGEDGATHAGVFDYAYMRCLPNMVIMAPKDENECYQMLQTAYQHKGTTAVRYPRGVGTGATIQKPTRSLEIGKSEIVFEGVSKKVNPKDATYIALLAFGSMVSHSVDLAHQLIEAGYGVTVVNMRFIKPLDTEMVANLANHYQLVTIEEHAVMAGAGSAVNEYVMSLAKPARVLNLGIPDRYIAHGSHQEQLEDAGLDVTGMFKRISTWLL